MSTRRNQTIIKGAAVALAFGASVGVAQASSRSGHACAGLPNHVAQASLAETHASHVESVTPLHREVRIGKQTMKRVAGARVELRPQPGMSAPYLQRVAECRVRKDLQAASAGDVVPEVRAKVYERSHHFVIEVEALDLDHGRDVERLTRKAFGAEASAARPAAASTWAAR